VGRGRVTDRPDRVESVIGRVVGVLALLATLPAPALAAPPDALDPIPGHDVRHARDAGATRPAPASRAKVADEDPLRVTINSLSPAFIPRRGPVRMSGTITNVSDETWSLINMHPVVSRSPITNVTDLELNAGTDAGEQFGERIVDPRAFETIDELEAGATVSYAVSIPHDVLFEDIDGTPGVYWIGIQALGQTIEGRDEPADGRARSFIPLLARSPDPVRAALVVPIRHEVLYARNGRLREVRGWARDLGPDGRLRNILDFATTAPPGAVTWLIDPGVLEAVRRLADGNPRRDLGPVSDGDGEPSESPDASGGEAAADGTNGGPTPARDNAERWAAEFLDRVRTLTQDAQVLGLPYGDVDMAAADELDPQMAARALSMSASSFNDFDIDAAPTVAAPSGFLSATSVAALDPDVTILASDAILAEPEADPADNPTAITVNAHDVDLFDAAASDGGPAPGPVHAELAVRQRLISEAALRSVDGNTTPLVVSMPFEWDPGASQTGFWDALDLPWLSVVPQSSVTQVETPHVASDDLVYPSRQNNRELDAASFAAADELIRAGVTLQNVLTQNSTVEREVAAQALTTTSYAMRSDPTAAALDADSARRSIQATFRKVRISAPPYVTLSSATGRFRVDLTNGLEQPVTVRIEALVDEDLEIGAPGKILLQGGSSTNVLLHVQSTHGGVVFHKVRLVVTDEEGTELGPHADLPIRSSQTGQVIWVIIGVGVALLFGTIVVRLVRRFRRRHDSLGATTEETA